MKGRKAYFRPTASRHGIWRAYSVAPRWAICAGFVTTLSLSPVAAATPPAETAPVAPLVAAASTPIAIAFMTSVLILKVTAFVLGYLIVRLGHDTLVKGVTGQIDFGFSGSGFKTKLKAASPGALFVLMGAAIILWGLMVEKPFTIKTVPPAESTPTAVEGGDTTGKSLHRAPVPK